MVMCTVTGNITNILGGNMNTTVDVQLSQKTTKYTDGSSQHIIYGSPQEVVVTSGVFTVALQDNINMETGVYYVFKINNQLFNRVVPDQATEDFWNLEEPT